VWDLGRSGSSPLSSLKGSSACSADRFKHDLSRSGFFFFLPVFCEAWFPPPRLLQLLPLVRGCPRLVFRQVPNLPPGKSFIGDLSSSILSGGVRLFLCGFCYPPQSSWLACPSTFWFRLCGGVLFYLSSPSWLFLSSPNTYQRS